MSLQPIGEAQTCICVFETSTLRNKNKTMTAYHVPTYFKLSSFDSAAAIYTTRNDYSAPKLYSNDKIFQQILDTMPR